MILFQIYMISCILLLASKDATSYKLKAKKDDHLTEKRINRWHRIGVVINLLTLFYPIYTDLSNWWLYISLTLLIRLAIYDIAFNYWGGLPYKHLGSTAWWDQFFSKIFGEKGAVWKSLTFLALLVGLNIIR